MLEKEQEMQNEWSVYDAWKIPDGTLLIKQGSMLVQRELRVTILAEPTPDFDAWGQAKKKRNPIYEGIMKILGLRKRKSPIQD